MESDEFSEVEDVPLRRKRKATAKAKKTKKKTSSRASNMPNCQLSEPLQKIIGTEELPRTQVTKKLWEYIKSKELQDPTDKRYILCDDLLESVFDTKRLFMMSIAKGLKDHLITKPNPNKPKTEDDGDEKVSKKSTKGGFNKLHELSEPLQDLLNEKYVSRPQVVKRLWDYIKENSLQDPTNKRNILNDSKMKSIFKVSKMSMFQMNKLIGDHLSPYDGPIPETSTEGFIVFEF
ncbi:SWIB/MDM2 domain-containing protein [Globomyces pollinis-pini]|nr:SWIB/MDM2 domain-containing protein [Globomyces pollinis-pini]